MQCNKVKGNQIESVNSFERNIVGFESDRKRSVKNASEHSKRCRKGGARSRRRAGHKTNDVGRIGKDFETTLLSKCKQCLIKVCELSNLYQGYSHLKRRTEFSL